MSSVTNLPRTKPAAALEAFPRFLTRPRLLLAAGAALLLAFWFWAGHPDLEYDRQPFSAWLRRAALELSQQADIDDDCLAAFQSFCKPGVERLVEAALPPHYRPKYIDFYERKIPRAIKRWSPIPEEGLARAAVEILKELHPPADWLIPGLAHKLERHREDWEVQAMLILGYSTDKTELALPFLIDGLHSTDRLT